VLSRFDYGSRLRRTVWRNVQQTCSRAMRLGGSQRILRSCPKFYANKKPRRLPGLRSTDWSACMKNRHRVSQAVSRLIRSQAAGARYNGCGRSQRILLNFLIIRPQADSTLSASSRSVLPRPALHAVPVR
jgi:hypothetical protein